MPTKQCHKTDPERASRAVWYTLGFDQLVWPTIRFDPTLPAPQSDAEDLLERLQARSSQPLSPDPLGLERFCDTMLAVSMTSFDPPASLSQCVKGRPHWQVDDLGF